MNLESLGKVAKYVSPIGQYLIVIDTFTEQSKYHSEEADESDGTYTRPTSTVIKTIEQGGWKLRQTMRVAGMKCSDVPKEVLCHYCKHNTEYYFAVSALLFETTDAP